MISLNIANRNIRRLSVHRSLPGRISIGMITLLLLSALVSCSHSHEHSTKIPLFDDLTVYHRTVTTQSAKAQEYFDQGFAFYYGFNHDAAIKSFQQVILLDSNCAMAWWGQAISAGPNINNPVMDSTAKIAAWKAVVRAREHIDRASTLEQNLINAISKRYAWPPPEDRRPLDSAYASAMRDIYKSFPDDPDVGVLYAESLMDLQPWDYWTPEGKPKYNTMEIVSVLENILERYPDHPGACHFYIHAIEASAEPGKALAAADILRNRVPGAGHLVHMPSHIDIRLGNYYDAIVANQKAIIADSIWMKSGGFYSVYRAHNHHFLAYAAMFDGQKDLAIGAARQIIEKIPEEQIRLFPDILEAFHAVPIHVLVRFGLWEDLLKEPAPPKDFYVTAAFRHYGRAVAFAALGRVAEAEAEYDSLLLAYGRIPESRYIGNNTAKTVLGIGLLMAEGELEYRKGNHDQAFDLLRLAVQCDDSLKYDEPWGWMMPVRHALGALLAEQGLYADAVDVYLEDLELHPENGWALKGLSDCYSKTGQDVLATNTGERFRMSWIRSDITLKASCFCSGGVKM